MTVQPRERLIGAQPRAQGDMRLSVKAGPRPAPMGATGRPASAIDKFRAQGCLKTLFPRRRGAGNGAVESILINTAGGLTGGDRLSVALTAGENAALSLTTQAAERAYRAASGMARMDSTLTVASGGRLDWLPQELIVFDGARLQRSLRADVAPGGALLAVEPVIFGRPAMGEEVRDAVFHDRLEITRSGRPLFSDALRLEGDLKAQMARGAVGGAFGAMALIVLVDDRAEAQLAPLRDLLPTTGGATLLSETVLVARVLANDGFALRQFLVPALQALAMGGCPVSWRL